MQLVESQFPDQKLNRGPGQRVLGVLSTGPPGNSRQVLNVSLTTCESGYWRDPPGTEKETEAFYGEVSFSFLSIKLREGRSSQSFFFFKGKKCFLSKMKSHGETPKYKTYSRAAMITVHL